MFTRTGTGSSAATGSGTTHAANSGVITKTFPTTISVEPYPEADKFVAFSIDDTFNTDTNDLLDVIEELGIKVTFYASGSRLGKVKTNPEMRRVLDRMLAAGHEIANHAYQHERWGGGVNLDVMRADFKRNQDLIYELTGKNTQWMRLPYHSSSADAYMAMGELGLSNSWGVDSNDWNIANSSSYLINRYLTLTGNHALQDGQVYVHHDQQSQTNTRYALPEIVHELRSRGYGFMTTSELRLHRNFPVLPGVNYNNFFERKIRFPRTP